MIPEIDGLTDVDHLGPAQKQLDNLAAHVECYVKLAAHAMGARPPGETTEDHLPPLFLLRHAASHAWALSRVVRGGHFEPTETLLRPMLEAVIGLEYMLEAKWTDRARAYQVCAWRGQIATHEMFDPSTVSGKQLATALSQDHFVGGMTSPVSISDVQKVIDAKKRLLTKPPYDSVDAERKATIKRLGKKHVAWYSLYGGPKNLRELSSSVRAEAIYLFLYGMLSEQTHAFGTMDALVNAGGSATIKHLADPTGIELSVTHGATLLLHAARRFVEWVGDAAAIAHNENLYATHIRATHLSIAGKKLFTMQYPALTDSERSA